MKTNGGNRSFGILSSIFDYARKKKYLSGLRRMFPRDKMVECPPALPSFPPKISLEPRDIHAYLVQFMVSEQDTEEVFKYVSDYFPFDWCSPGQDKIATNRFGEALQVSVRYEFNGVLFDLITNSIEFLRALDATQIKPPPPWVAFPRIKDPDTLGSLQGDIEYWWNGYWSPYWDGLTDQQRNTYLTAVGASKEWIECIEAHRSKH